MSTIDRKDLEDEDLKIILEALSIQEDKLWNHIASLGSLNSTYGGKITVKELVKLNTKKAQEIEMLVVKLKGLI